MKTYTMVVDFEAEDDEQALETAEKITKGKYDRMKVSVYQNSLINQPVDPSKTRFRFGFTDFVGNISTPAG